MKKLLFILLIFNLLVISGCGETSTDEDIQDYGEEDTQTQDSTSETQTGEVETKDYTFIQKITYEEEDSKTIITKNKILKTATIEMNIFYEESDLKKGSFLTNLTVGIGCGIIMMAVFNETALEEFNTQIEEWNSQEYTVEDDSPPEEKEEQQQENPLEGYTINKVQIYFKYKSTKDKFAECTLTGASESDITIKIY